MFYKFYQVLYALVHNSSIVQRFEHFYVIARYKLNIIILLCNSFQMCRYLLILFISEYRLLLCNRGPTLLKLDLRKYPAIHTHYS